MGTSAFDLAAAAFLGRIAERKRVVFADLDGREPGGDRLAAASKERAEQQQREAVPKLVTKSDRKE
jgi:hypothetical protein